MKFYYVEYRMLLDPTTYMDILIVDDFAAWVRERQRNHFYICYSKEITATEAMRLQYKASQIRIIVMNEEDDNEVC